MALRDYSPLPTAMADAESAMAHALAQLWQARQGRRTLKGTGALVRTAQSAWWRSGACENAPESKARIDALARAESPDYPAEWGDSIITGSGQVRED